MVTAGSIYTKKFCVLNFTCAGYNCSLSVMTHPNPLPFSANVSFIISDDSERNYGYSEDFPANINTHVH
jgi:hypothetical protein